LTFLLLNQTFYPDVMATGQYLTEVAVRLVERGHQVTVVTSRRAYDHPETEFAKAEIWRGIRIIRIGSTGFGKGAKWRRAADFASFIVSCCARLAMLPRHDRVVALTTPPLISFVGAWFARFWRASFFYWVMDFNPDEAIAAGWLRSGSPAARLLESMSRFSLRRARKVIALDRFMRDRILAKGTVAEKIVVIPPWSHDAEVRFDLAGRERFRRAHGLDGKFVVMYSGNHSPVHPLETLLQAAERMRSDKGVVFCFVGGGSEWRKIGEKAEGGRQKAEDGGRKTEDGRQQAEGGGQKTEGGGQKAEGGGQKAEGGGQKTEGGGQKAEGEGQKAEDGGQKTEGGGQKAEGGRQKTESENQGAEAGAVCSHVSVSAFQRSSFSNVTCLPYQPLDQLAGSLSAADLQVVVMGNEFVGLVHPCKIYNILSVAAPVLYIGPRPSHLSELLDGLNQEYSRASAAHGEVDRVIQAIERFRRQPGLSGRQAPDGVRAVFSKEALLPRLVQELEEGQGRDD
jgi:glycosyltransferase involved in cell wall biosynthesis